MIYIFVFGRKEVFEQKVTKIWWFLFSILLLERVFGFSGWWVFVGF